MDILKSGANVFLTGEPGSGKTHTVNQYVSYLRSYSIEPSLTASTGIAATHISGMTIHSWSGIGINSSLSDRDLTRIAANERVHRRLTKAKVLIIDEVSMLDARTLEMVDAVTKTVRRDGRPFGGLQVVLVGDFFQLPPVSRAVPGQVSTNHSLFAFHSSAWELLRPTVCYITEQHRQDDAAFVSLLSAIRAGEVEDAHFGVLRERVSSHEAAPKDIVKLFSHNADVDAINAKELTKLPGIAQEFTLEAYGPTHLIEALLRGCLSPKKLFLKQGAAVMFTRNDPQGRFVNGTLGVITGFDSDIGCPIVRTRGGATLTAEPMEWKIEDQGRALASLQQIPLRLAWAMTIHKSQGMSLDAALVDLGSAFEFGQGYVALSRVRRLSGLFLLGCNERATQVHPEILVQDRLFRDASQEAEIRIDTITAEAKIVRERNFIAACGGKEKKVAPSSISHSTKEGGKAGSSSWGVRSAEYPKAYARWTTEEETELTTMFQNGGSVKDMAAHFSRQTGGITSRLKKLGLIQDMREGVSR